MNWREEYKSKCGSHAEAAKLVHSGDRLFTPLGLGEPSTGMMDAVADRKDELREVEYVSALEFHPYKIFGPECQESFTLICGFYSKMTMFKHMDGTSSYAPVQSSSVGRVARERQKMKPRRQGMITQVSPPDEHGYVSLGLDLFYTPEMFDQVDWFVAEVNPNMPRTYGNTHYHISRFAT